MSDKTISLYGFASVPSPEVVKDFLEEYTGEGTVYALEAGLPKGEGSRAHARVQFTNAESAETICLLCEQKLWFGKSYLKARYLDRDIIVEPSVFHHGGVKVTLYFGCQIDKEKFSVSWKQTDVTLEVGSRKFYFFLSFNSREYKLELSSENIWEIKMHRSSRPRKKFLIIQLLGAPRIYERDVPALCYYKEATNDQWVRQLDFTPSCSIGHSSAMLLELSRWEEPPNFYDMCYYKESEGRLVLERGYTFSSSFDLVPIVSPPRGFELPYEILFKVNSLVQHGCLPGQALHGSFFQLVDPRRHKLAYIESALEQLYNLKECCYDPVRWINDRYQEYEKSGRVPKSPYIGLDNGLVYVRRVQVTPCKVYFCGPEVNLSNRVLRNYAGDINNFLRVSFVDEELEKLYSIDLSPRGSSSGEERRTRIYERVLSVIRNGIIIGEKHFEFLAFSSSQLRDNSLWMFASRPGLTAADIREGMGDFREIRNVARYAARLGQSFSSSRETFKIKGRDVELIPDVENLNYVFSDGIGKISKELAETVAKKCGCKDFTPSAFQIRYGGYKGVVAVDPTSETLLSLRKSMRKYESSGTNLDILSWSKYQPSFLNRQLITLMSTLGVRDRVFIKKQKEALAQLNDLLTDPLKAREALELMSPGENTNVLKEMLLSGYNPESEPFLSMMLRTFRAAKLHDLRTKTRIFVRKGRCMMGCLDETGTLEYGQVFVQFSAPKYRPSSDDSLQMLGDTELHRHNCIVTGHVVVAKNPCLHPGDMRVLRAVDVPALHHMVDCVVFPQKGKRPHPNECSGSDLDGDVYFICWDSDLIPKCLHQPMDYTPAPSIRLDHDVTIEEVAEYFVNYILNYSLGIISNAHLVFADREPRVAGSEPCIELAQLSSIAVDFAKTGVPAKIPPNLRPQEYPDFLEKSDKPTYESQRVIGKLFRDVIGIASQATTIKPFTLEIARKSYDPDMEVVGFENHIRDASYHKSEYDNKLASLMRYYGIKTESEILSGCIVKLSKYFEKRKDYLEQIVLAVKALRKEARSWFNEKGSESEINAKASAWYYVTYHPSFWGFYTAGTDRDHFISFPWCIYDKLLRIKREKARNSLRALRSVSSSLEHMRLNSRNMAAGMFL